MNNRERPASLRVWFGSTLFAVGQVLATVVFSLVALVVLPTPRRFRYFTIMLWCRFVLWWLETTCDLKHETKGLENIPSTPCVVLCKHQSTWETLALQEFFSPQSWVLKRQLLWIPFFGWGLAALSPIAIDREASGSAMAQIIERGGARLKDRWWVVIFPEGTRTAPGQPSVYKKGGARLACATGAAIVPVAHNAGVYWPRNSFLKFPGVIRIAIGEPIETAGRSPNEVHEAAKMWIETATRELVTHARQVSPG